MIEFKSVLNKKEKIPWRIIENEAVVVDVCNGNVMQLNETASQIWGIIDGEKSVEQIIEYICDCFDVDKDTAASDVIEFLAEIYKKGLIVNQ